MRIFTYVRQQRILSSINMKDFERNRTTVSADSFDSLATVNNRANKSENKINERTKGLPLKGNYFGNSLDITKSTFARCIRTQEFFFSYFLH